MGWTGLEPVSQFMCPATPIPDSSTLDDHPISGSGWIRTSITPAKEDNLRSAVQKDKFVREEFYALCH